MDINGGRGGGWNGSAFITCERERLCRAKCSSELLLVFVYDTARGTSTPPWMEC